MVSATGNTSTNFFPARPQRASGAQGREMKLFSNFFQIEFEDKNVLPFDTLQFELTMFAPANAPINGDEAFNSFACNKS